MSGGQEAPPDRRPRELRVHGVGGSPGARMLGWESPADVAVVGEGAGGTTVWASRHDPTVEGYDWGDLTSGSGTQPFWVLLLPFTVLNLAGWMHPPDEQAFPSQVSAIRGLVHVLSVLLTAAYVLTLAVLLVDLGGYQWSRRVAGATASPASVLLHQRVGVAAGLVVLLAAIVALARIGGASQARFEQTGPNRTLVDEAHLGPETPWGDDERLDRLSFFWHPGSAGRRWRLHVGVLAAAYLAVVAVVVSRFTGFGTALPPRLDVQWLLDRVGLGAAVALLLLWLVSLPARRGPSSTGERWTRGGPAIAATLSWAMVHATFSGALLLAVKRLGDWPHRPPSMLPLDAAGGTNLVDVWGSVLIALVLAAVLAVLLVRFKPLASAADLPARTSPPGRRLDGVDGATRTAVARARFVARLAHGAGRGALVVAAGLFVVYAVAVAARHRGLDLPSPSAHALKTVPYRVGAYVLPLLPLLLFQLMRKGRSGARTFVSTLWDVFTFWPRRFAPLGVRPYAERAVPELQGRIVRHVVEGGRPVVVSAHSQGTILAFAALASLSADCTRHVNLVTYGSPVTTIYGTLFPAYFGQAEVDKVRDRLRAPGPGLLGWRNFYRATDPIGGPVFRDPDGDGGAPPGDRELDDPASTPDRPPDDLGPPLEHDRPAWCQIAVHSYYLQEPELKRWVADVKAALAAGRAGG